MLTCWYVKLKTEKSLLLLETCNEYWIKTVSRSRDWYPRHAEMSHKPPVLHVCALCHWEAGITQIKGEISWR